MTIKHLKLTCLLLGISFLFFLTACGGGGGGSTPTPTPAQAQAQKVAVTFSLNGDAATTVGAVDLDVTLPAGFALETGTDGQPTANALTFLLNGATNAINYTPETTANGGIIVGIVMTNGFPGNSNLLKITRTYAAGATLPTANDFMVTLTASDLDGVTIGTISELISITTQAVP